MSDLVVMQVAPVDVQPKSAKPVLAGPLYCFSTRGQPPGEVPASSADWERRRPCFAVNEGVGIRCLGCHYACSPGAMGAGTTKGVRYGADGAVESCIFCNICNGVGRITQVRP
jgi:hypothetical protein